MGSVPLALKRHVVGPTRPRRGIENPEEPPELFKIRCRSVVTNPIPNANNTVEFSESLTIFPNRNAERKGTRPNPMAERKQSKMESTPMRNGAERGGVPQSRDSKKTSSKKNNL
ncbi:hypothetical protein NDU88_002562 [Pleurodeles waltl]|uniref:Uncharacterized protein n=1 Tax=Pleurodeles waltl TaxID=8319 RepID=A0AAV7PFL5_PLEWA|nr:hypothetical protein NDU88_002562 [Pleurodeles waltl]